MNKTYERILYNINEYLIENARRILILLCFALKLIIVQELINNIVVEVENFIKLNCKRRLQDFNNIHNICFDIVNINFDDNSINEVYYNKDLTLIVQIINFFVQKYLKFKRIKFQKIAIFSLNNVIIYIKIARTYLIYLLEINILSLKLN